MITVLTMLIALLVIHVNLGNDSTDNSVIENFLKDLISATRERYAAEYIKLRSEEESTKVLIEHLSMISSTRGVMNLFDYREFKDGICTAIFKSDKSLSAELCFIHDLMIEEYHNVVPSKKVNCVVGINEFYNLIRTHL